MSTTQTPAETDTGPAHIDGPPAASLIAAGIGAVTLGLFITLAEASTGTKDFLKWSDRVGPLAGKTILAVLAYFGSFLILGLAWRGKTFALKSILTAAGILLALGLLFTFPPILQIFTSE